MGIQNQNHSLPEQGSIYSLTLNEVQNQLGKSLHHMNLDELLDNVLPQQVHDKQPFGNHSSGAGLDIHESINNTSITVDELWMRIQQQKGDVEQRARPLGEMTLEDFLKKAGVIPCESAKRSNAQWLQQQQQQAHQSMMSAHVSSRTVPPTIGTGAASDRKRGATEEMSEKTVARRQKRMIKNRESAARSRARRQAYTNELENKIMRLEEENEDLRKQKELDIFLQSTPFPEPKHQLCRSFSAPL